MIGWVLIVLGLAGLILPILQGILFLVLGSAMLSLVDDRAFALTRRLFARWPGGWLNLLRVRRRMLVLIDNASTGWKITLALGLLSALGGLVWLTVLAVAG
ncbi:MAG: hypothetical protein AAGN46_16630 [Acidobacteriota bacterium]